MQSSLTHTSIRPYLLQGLLSESEVGIRADGVSDGMGVGVMLEVARVLVDRNQAINGSIVFRGFASDRVGRS